MSGICDTCKLKPRCISPANKVMKCSLYEQNRKDRWYELFGTPERAARTLENGTPMCDWCDTNACEKKGGECSLFNYDALLDWLMGESE